MAGSRSASSRAMVIRVRIDAGGTRSAVPGELVGGVVTNIQCGQQFGLLGMEQAKVSLDR